MFCQFCGTQLRHTARYCKNCGGRVDEYYENEPIVQRMTVPLRADEHVPQPWRQNEDAIILPITRELPREPIEEIETDSEYEVVPISHATLPTLVESPAPLEIPRQAPIGRADPGSDSGGKPEQAVSPPRPAAPARRGKRITLGIPLLMLAVILLFVLAYLAMR